MSGEKTEKPTPKRLRDARKKGQVAKSREISSTANVIGIFVFFWIFSDHFLATCKSMILAASQAISQPFAQAFPSLMGQLTVAMVRFLLPLFLLVIVAGIASNYFQIGFLMAFESIKPDLKKINPVNAIKRIFSKKNLIEFVKSIIKITFLGITVYFLLSGFLSPMMQVPQGEVINVLQLLGTMLKKLVIYTSMAFIIIAAADYFFQKSQHMKELMMTKEEVKQEYKEMEGDPQIKSKRRQLHQELLRNNMLENVRKSTVVITNPTHLAVALYYEKGKTPLPKVTAKGENLLAKRIVEIAKEEGIPIMSDVPLARALYEEGALNDYIPSDLIEPVAEVLKWVIQLKQSGQG